MPRFIDIRDVLEHFDDYDRGMGKLQKAGAPIQIDAHPIVGGSTLYLQGLSLELHSSLDAARALSRAARAVVWRVGGVGDIASDDD